MRFPSIFYCRISNGDDCLKILWKSNQTRAGRPPSPVSRLAKAGLLIVIRLQCKANTLTHEICAGPRTSAAEPTLESLCL